MFILFTALPHVPGGEQEFSTKTKPSKCSSLLHHSQRQLGQI